MTDSFDAEDAQYFINGITSKYPDIVIQESRKMENMWDWHIAWERQRAHQELFWGNSYGYVCRLGVFYLKEQPHLYPWSEIIQSFQFYPMLLQERERENLEAGRPQYYGFDESSGEK
jgi:hypothetical protein